MKTRGTTPTWTLLLLVVLLAACSQTTLPEQESEAPVQIQRAESDLTTLVAPTLNTRGYTPYFEQYDLTGRQIAAAGELADDFVVPAGSTWRVTHIGFIGYISSVFEDSFDYTLNIYHDASGSPGSLLRSDVVTVVDEQVVTPSSFFTLFALPEPLILTAGIYWLSMRTGIIRYEFDRENQIFHTNWREVPADTSSSPHMLKTGSIAWESTSASNLAFGLYELNLTTQDVIDAFDGFVSGGTLRGSGSGSSAAGRLNALRNMLEAGDTEGACGQLRQAYLRTDGLSPVEDFITGADAPMLARMIRELMDSIGCS